MKKIKTSLVLRKAKDWIGTPFLIQGRSKDLGCDCIGLIFGIAGELRAGTLYNSRCQFSQFDQNDYDIYSDSARLNSCIPRHLSRVKDGIEPGHVVLFKVDWRHWHIGIVSAAAQSNVTAIIHACLRRNTVVEQNISVSLGRRVVGCFAFVKSERLDDAE